MPLKPHRKLLLGLKLLNFLKMSDNHSMENPKNISGNASASRLSIANLSVALSFILATLFSTGAILQSAVGLRSRIPVLPSFQIQLIEIITAYWLPTIVVYALIRITGFDSRPNSEWQVSRFNPVWRYLLCLSRLSKAHQQQPMNISPKKYCS
ncbi:MAG: hypothetical protein IPJ38_00995 [Dechloromonas sp.]|uniref:Uncharacterized protein n=1 Tax=Candidatus Dechloromonas phosphorivorans TaxID=2899244 RepID=A0A935N1R3_9RHOO|nr:hypothetical protein [Candidatus Dechloromonas phosphorivorans]